MAKLAVIARDKKKLKLVERYAKKRAALKKAKDWAGLDKLPRSSSKVRLHNRCKITGRSRGFMVKFGVCRNQFRKLAGEGKIPGITKSNW